MPITYDIEKDSLYIQGLERGEALGEARGEARGEAQGEARGEARGLQRGAKQATLKIVENCFHQGVSADLAATLTGIELKQVLVIYQELDQKKA